MALISNLPMNFAQESCAKSGRLILFAQWKIWSDFHISPKIFNCAGSGRISDFFPWKKWGIFQI